MKQVVVLLCLLLMAVSAAPVLACDCDTATGILLGVPDRLHQAWPNDPERQKNRPKDSENGPKQEVQPANQNPQSGGENKK